MPHDKFLKGMKSVVGKVKAHQLKGIEKAKSNLKRYGKGYY